MVDIFLPHGLGPDGKWFFEKALFEREFRDVHDLARLEIAARLLDDIRSDENLIEKEGRFSKGRFNRLYPHPAIKIIAENRAIFIRVITALGLDIVDDRGGQERLF